MGRQLDAVEAKRFRGSFKQVRTAYGMASTMGFKIPALGKTQTKNTEPTLLASGRWSSSVPKNTTGAERSSTRLKSYGTYLRRTVAMVVG